MSSIEGINIGDLLPQRPPFCFVDRLVSYEEPDLVTEFTVREDCIFAENGALRASGLIENMAQSSAARVGYINKYVKGGDVKIGYIGSVKALKVNRCPSVGETVRTTITLKQEVFNISMVGATVCVGDEVIAEAVLKTVDVD